MFTYVYKTYIVKILLTSYCTYLSICTQNTHTHTHIKSSKRNKLNKTTEFIYVYNCIVYKTFMHFITNLLLTCLRISIFSIFAFGAHSYTILLDSNTGLSVSSLSESSHFINFDRV